MTVSKCVKACMVLLAVLSSVGMAEDKVVVGQDDFGIVAGAKTDQTKAIQSYLDKLGELGGGVANLQPGTYQIHGSINIPTGVTLSGSWEIPHHGIISKGTLLEIYGGRGQEAGPAAIEMQQSSGIRGITFQYPEQTLEDLKEYPWTIHGRGMHNTIENVTLVNSYQGITMGPESNELHVIRNVYGCVLRCGVKIDSCTDIGRIENVHFNPHYWPRSGAPGVPPRGNRDLTVAAVMQKNLEAFIFCRTDWEYVFNTFVFAAKAGYTFTSNARGGACNGQLVGIGADMCQYGVVVDKAQPWGILITNGEFVCGQLAKDQAEDRAAIWTKETFEGSLQLTNCSFWGFYDTVMNLEGKGFVSLSQGTINTNTKGANPLIWAKGGRVALSQLFFNCDGPHIQAEPAIIKCNVTDCFSTRGVHIVNKAGNKLVATNNEEK